MKYRQLLFLMLLLPLMATAEETGPDFDDYVDGRFKDGTGWNYKSVDRTIRFSNRSDVAWFDEVLYSETNGRIRSTGVLTRQSGQWKLEHYAMSFLIFNENWDEVIELTMKTRAIRKSNDTSLPPVCLLFSIADVQISANMLLRFNNSSITAQRGKHCFVQGIDQQS